MRKLTMKHLVEQNQRDKIGPLPRDYRTTEENLPLGTRPADPTKGWPRILFVARLFSDQHDWGLADPFAHRSLGGVLP